MVNLFSQPRAKRRLTVDNIGEYRQFIVGLATGKGNAVVALIED